MDGGFIFRFVQRILSSRAHTGLRMLHGGHVPAGLGAAAAGFGAFLAVISVVFAALFAAGIAHLGAELADSFREL